MTILITGASGLIGSALLRSPELFSGRTIHAVARRPTDNTSRDVRWHACDLLAKGTIESVIETIRPTHVIHAAWETTHGQFWGSESNRNWLSASLRLLDAFERNGGERFLFLGSMAEYDWSTAPCVENVSPEIPLTLYGETKLAFHHMVMQHAWTKKFSAATGRIFNLYGPNEKPERLVPQILGALAQARRIKVGHADRKRDILHVDDVARGLVALLDSGIEGAVNIANGDPIRMGDLYDVIGHVTARGDLIRIGERADTPGEPKSLYADAALIRSTGWRPAIRLEDGLRALWERQTIRHAA